MGRIPLDPVLSPTIELNRRDPAAHLIRDEDWTCPQCEDHYGLDVEGQERACVVCMIKKSGDTSIMLFGWTIMKAASQVIARPPKHRVDGK